MFKAIRIWFVRCTNWSKGVHRIYIFFSICCAEYISKGSVQSNLCRIACWERSWENANIGRHWRRACIRQASVTVSLSPRALFTLNASAVWNGSIDSLALLKFVGCMNNFKARTDSLKISRTLIKNAKTFFSAITYICTPVCATLCFIFNHDIS